MFERLRAGYNSADKTAFVQYKVKNYKLHIFEKPENLQFAKELVQKAGGGKHYLQNHRIGTCDVVAFQHALF